MSQYSLTHSLPFYISHASASLIHHQQSFPPPSTFSLLFLSLLSLTHTYLISEMEHQIMKRQTTLPPRRGLVKIRVINSLFKSATAWASVSGDGERNNGNSNGIDDGGHSPSTTPTTPNGYNSDRNN